MTVKAFVLDTNVLLHSAQSLESFTDNDVVIPMAVIEELDKFKKNSDQLGRNARQVIRHLDALRKAELPKTGCLRHGVPLKHISATATGKLYVLSTGEFDLSTLDGPDARVFRHDLAEESPDNRILKVAVGLQASGRHVVFISKDINLRLKADAMGLRVMDFERGKVDTSALYTGFAARDLSADKIETLYHERKLTLPKPGLLVNEFAVFSAGGKEGTRQSALARLHADGVIHLLDHGRTDRVWNVTPRNKEQRMALDLLLDPTIRLVTLVGGAGTGKTLLALAAALQLTQNEKLYERILVSRPIIPLGNDIGYLPGDKDAKLNSWMQPIFDNLDYLLGAEEEPDGKKNRSGRLTKETLMRNHTLELEALTYIRGRSIPRQFVIVDEAQNLTPHEIKTIVSRCGEDTKMVLTGDPHQIDNPYLDASSNGLSYTVERLKGQPVFGHVTLARSERSELAALAAGML